MTRHLETALDAVATDVDPTDVSPLPILMAIAEAASLLDMPPGTKARIETGDTITTVYRRVSRSRPGANND